jgi:hypothetical protein
MSTIRITRQHLRNFAPLLLVLLLALALRLLLWGRIPRTGLISDEGEYLSAASWLAQGRSFSWYQNYLWTRAPLYPLFVAAHLRLFGDTLAPIYITQTLLSLLNVALVYLLARYLIGHHPQTAGDGRGSQFAICNSQFFVPTVAALLMALYLPFALFAQMLLSETLFITLLLAGFLTLAVWNSTTDDRQLTAAEPGRWSVVSGRWLLVVAGGLFGLATLTRSLTLAFLPLVALWLLLDRPRTMDDGRMVAGRDVVGGRAYWSLVVRRWPASICFFLSAVLMIAPWTLYNSTRLYGGLVMVDTSGSFNLLLGARTAYDGGRNDAATRDFVLLLLGQKQASELTTPPCAPLPAPLPSSQAARQAAMTREGLCLIGARPLAFLQKSLGELVDLFQINYTGAERLANGFGVGRLPRWYALSLFLLDDSIYVLMLPLAVLGWALIRRTTNDERRTMDGTDDNQPSFVIGHSSLVVLVGLWLLYNIAVAPLLFAINRFRLPLLPFAFIFSAYALAALPSGWRALRSRYGLLCVALAGLLALVAATPYAYLEPRQNAGDSRWASYFGPYPSSIAASVVAWRARPGYLLEQQVLRALGSGDAAGARALVRRSDVTSHTLAIALPLLEGLTAQPDAGLKLLPALETITQTKDVELAVVRGDLLRRAGDQAGARFIFTQRFVDDANPVQWAWDWLHPPALPSNHIDLAGNLDLGYIEGCYLGEGDRAAQGNFRWCTDGARLRFPAAGTGAPQQLTLRADGRGWFDGLKPPSAVHVLLGDQEAGVFTPDSQAVGEFQILLPASPAAADVIVTLHMDTFIPGADRYLSQQGKPVVGQVQRLGVRLDWAELH